MSFYLTIKTAEELADIETAIHNDMKVLNYKRLPDLIRYMHGMDYLTKTILNNRKDNIVIPQLNNFLLEDSYFSSFVINSVQQTCSITLSNVLVYNDSRLDYSTDVNVNTILINFLDVGIFHMNGSIDTEAFGLNRIYKWYTSVADNKMYTFEIFVLSNLKKFLFSVQCSSVEVTII